MPSDLHRPERIRIWALLRVIIGVGRAIGVSAHRHLKAGAHCAEVFAETVAIFVLVFTLLALG